MSFLIWFLAKLSVANPFTVLVFFFFVKKKSACVYLLGVNLLKLPISTVTMNGANVRSRKLITARFYAHRLLNRHAPAPGRWLAVLQRGLDRGFHTFPFRAVTQYGLPVLRA